MKFWVFSPNRRVRWSRYVYSFILEWKWIFFSFRKSQDRQQTCLKSQSAFFKNAVQLPIFGGEAYFISWKRVLVSSLRYYPHYLIWNFGSSVPIRSSSYWSSIDKSSLRFSLPIFIAFLKMSFKMKRQITHLFMTFAAAAKRGQKPLPRFFFFGLK